MSLTWQEFMRTLSNNIFVLLACFSKGFRYPCCSPSIQYHLSFFKDTKNCYTSFLTLPCRGFKTESRKSTFYVVTSRVGSSFSASIIEELKYLLKALFSIFFKLAFVDSYSCNRCVMFFGNVTDSISCFDRTSDTLKALKEL